jgi:predicted nuclease of predicted toxin-antitoxin system
VKFIVDAQLPKSLSEFLNEKGFDSIHTLELLQLNNTSDSAIISIAIEQKRVVITKDKDFLESFLLNSKPEKLIIVRTGNITNQLLIKLFQDNIEYIVSLLLKSNLLEITTTEITEHK